MYYRDTWIEVGYVLLEGIFNMWTFHGTACYEDGHHYWKVCGSGNLVYHEWACLTGLFWSCNHWSCCEFRQLVFLFSLFFSFFLLWDSISMIYCLKFLFWVCRFIFMVWLFFGVCFLESIIFLHAWQICSFSFGFYNCSLNVPYNNIGRFSFCRAALKLV